jgi:hypothetical protein
MALKMLHCKMRCSKKLLLAPQGAYCVKTRRLLKSGDGNHDIRNYGLVAFNAKLHIK